MNENVWVAVILVYYLLATLLPIDKLIGKLYPVFGIVLAVMAVGIFGGLIAGGYQLPELSLVSQHPSGTPAWPYMFVTVACGAVSGFHATQSPMMARCIRSERDGRKVFYGAMLAEGVIALVWASAGVAFYGSTGGLQAALAQLGQSGVVYELSVSLLGVLAARWRWWAWWSVRSPRRHGLSQRAPDHRRLVPPRPDKALPGAWG